MRIEVYKGQEKNKIYSELEFLNEYYYPINLKRSNIILVTRDNKKVSSFLGINQRNGWWYF